MIVDSGYFVLVHEILLSKTFVHSTVIVWLFVGYKKAALSDSTSLLADLAVAGCLTAGRMSRPMASN